MIIHQSWWYANDPYNKKGYRNTANTEREEYNCIGYAFDVFANINIGGRKENASIMCAAAMGDYETALAEAQFELEKEFPEWTCVQDYSKHNYPARRFKVVAIRFSTSDYHAYKLGKNNRWYNKWGRSEIIENLPYAKVFAKEWRTAAFLEPYDSPILFFVRPR